MVRYGSTNDLEEGVREAVSGRLRSGESFLGGVRVADSVRGKRQTRLLLTNDRLITAKPTRSGIKIGSMNRDDIVEIDYDSGLLNAELSISGRNGTDESWTLQTDGSDAFVAALGSTDSYEMFVGDDNQSVIPDEIGGSADNETEETSSTSLLSDPKSTDLSDFIQSGGTSNHPSELSPPALASRLQGMDNYEFEQFVGALWTRMGWQTVVSQASADAGIDVVATKDSPYPQKKVIQAKRHGENSTVGGPDIQQYASLKEQVPGADSVVIVTTSSFTSSARDLADKLNVKLVDGETLATMIGEFDAYDLVASYLDSPIVSPASDSPIGTEDGREGSESTTDEHPTGEVKEGTGSASVRRTESVAEAVSRDGGVTRQEVTDSPEKYDLSTEGPGSVSERYYQGVIGGTAVGLLATAAGAGSLMLVSMIATSVLLYVDARGVRRSGQDWEPRGWLYIAGILFAFVGPIVYVFRRWRRTESNDG